MKTKLIVVACCLFLFVAVISGCNLQKMVAVQVPAGVQKSLEIDAGTNLHNAEYVYASWQSFVEVNTQELLANIDSANETYSTLASFVDLGFDVASNHAGSGRRIYSTRRSSRFLPTIRNFNGDSVSVAGARRSSTPSTF